MTSRSRSPGRKTVADTPTVTFDLGIYNRSCLLAAADVYSELMQVTFEDGDGAAIASFHGMESGHSQMLVDAFCNHALFETIQQFRAEEASV